MKYNPEAVEAKPTEGEGKFFVVNATEEISGNNNDMMVLDIDVWDKNGIKGSMRDYFPNKDNCIWKLKSLCSSANVMDKFKTGFMATEDFKALEGNCVLKYEEYTVKGGPNEGEKRKSLKIAKYLKRKEGEEIKSFVKEGDYASVKSGEINQVNDDDSDLDEDVPF